MGIKRRIKSEEERMNKRIQVLMDSKQIQFIQEMADKLNLSFSEYVRRAALGKIDFQEMK